MIKTGWAKNVFCAYDENGRIEHYIGSITQGHYLGSDYVKTMNQAGYYWFINLRVGNKSYSEHPLKAQTEQEAKKEFINILTNELQKEVQFYNKKMFEAEEMLLSVILGKENVYG